MPLTEQLSRWALRAAAVVLVALLGAFPLGASASVDPAQWSNAVQSPDAVRPAGATLTAGPGAADPVVDTRSDPPGIDGPTLGSAGGGQVADPTDGGPAAGLSAPPASTNVAAATALSPAQDFDAGNIISDAVFTDDHSMDDGQLAQFLATRGVACVGAFCLSHLLVDSVDQPADEFCTAYVGGHQEAAAAVIGKVSRACGINPQVMIATLQKESGLVDSPGPAAASYAAAWGWHCPDTGPGGEANCDPAFAGFFNQLYGMAKQWSRYRVTPDRYRYHAGETVQILWNVAESGCGSAPVTIANAATAALYNYTPYQPNAASLAAYPGVGDACSSYGNRNFFYLFRSYFGSTGGGKPVGAPADTRLEQTTVVIPAAPFVAAGAAGRSIIAPTAAVARGLRAGFRSLGMPYVWGGGGSGAGPDNGCARGGRQFNSCGAEVGFDCSGLTAYVLGQAGFAIPGDSAGQRKSGVPIAVEHALPGDIVGFPGHVAVYLGRIDAESYILEASWVGSPVHLVPLARRDADPVVHRYWTGATPPAGTGRGDTPAATASVSTTPSRTEPHPTVATVQPANVVAALAESGIAVPAGTTPPVPPASTSSLPPPAAPTTATSTESTLASTESTLASTPSATMVVPSTTTTAPSSGPSRSAATPGPAVDICASAAEPAVTVGTETTPPTTAGASGVGAVRAPVPTSRAAALPTPDSTPATVSSSALPCLVGTTGTDH